MTQTRILHPQWRDSHERTPYPFTDSSTLRSAGGRTVPESTFLDASLHPIGSVAGLRLSSITVRHRDITLTVGDRSRPSLASVSFSATSPPDLLRLEDSQGRAAGVLVSEADRLSVLGALGLGVHNFPIGTADFVSDVHLPIPEPGVAGLLLDDGTVLTGDVWLVGGDGVAITTASAVGPDGLPETWIRVDAVGDPLHRRRACGDAFVTPRPLRELVFRRGCDEVLCGPDLYGGIRVMAGDQDAEDTVLRIRATPEGLRIETVGRQAVGG